MRKLFLMMILATSGLGCSLLPVGYEMKLNIKGKMPMSGLLITPTVLLIRASIINNKCVLITANIKHFQNIPNVLQVKPSEIDSI